MANLSRYKENGNVLWFILLAVALLGILTMVLSRSGSSVDQSGDIEQYRIQASKILRYAKSLEVAVQQLLQQGCSEQDISFWHDSNDDGTEDSSDTYYNDISPDDHSCHVFMRAGAGLTYQAPDPSWLVPTDPGVDGYYGTWFFTGSICVAGIGASTDDCNVSARPQELLVYLPYLRLNLCKQLNKVAGNPAGFGDPPQDHSNAWALAHNVFDGAYGSNIRNLGGTNIDGKTTGCFEGGGLPTAGTYHLYHVLIPR